LRSTMRLAVLGSLLLAAVVAVSTAGAATLERRTVPSRAHNEASFTAPRSSILPAYRFDESVAAERLSATPSYQVERIEFRGHSAITDSELADLGAPYAGRALNFRDLVALRDAVTLLYVNRGYVTSGAAIRSLQDGVLLIEIVEGRLAGIEVSSDGRLRERYVAQYLNGFGPMEPVNVLEMEERLQLLQLDTHVARVDAQLLPGPRRGEAFLHVQPIETSPWAIRVEGSNHLNPAVGGWQGFAAVDALNLSGRTDDLHVAIRGSEGLKELSAEYAFPVGARGSRLAAYGFAADSEIVTEPFSALDIEAESRTYGLRLSHPLHRALDGQSSLSLNFEWRESETFLLGSGFSFVDGPQEGVAKIAVLRAGWERLRRSQRNVVASRVELSMGINGLGATRSNDRSPDGKFIKALLRLQWARRLEFLSSQLVWRNDAQLANDPLLGLEQIAVGGRWTVRGYRENTLIRDSAVISSLEWRIPILRDVRGVSRLELRPFVDWSHSWNHDRAELGPRELFSTGVGVHWAPRAGIEAELYWGEALNNIDYPGGYDLQDDGIHFRFTWEAL
jgi:hemolysin activation/secretion protein